MQIDPVLLIIAVSTVGSVLGSFLGLGLAGVGPLAFLSDILWPRRRRVIHFCRMNHDKHQEIPRPASWRMRLWFVLATRTLGWFACKLKLTAPDEWGRKPVYFCDECFRRIVLPWARRWAFRRIR